MILPLGAEASRGWNKDLSHFAKSANLGHAILDCFEPKTLVPFPRNVDIDSRTMALKLRRESEYSRCG